MKNKEIKQRMRKAKKDWIVKQCKQMELLQEPFDSMRIEKLNIQGQQKQGTTKENFGTDEKIETKTKYIQNMHKDSKSWQLFEIEEDEYLEILQLEVQRVVAMTHARKATGPDVVPENCIELLKII